MKLKTFFFAWIIATASFAAPVSILKNGDFEKTDQTGKLPENWVVTGENVRLSATPLPDGKQSLYIEIPTPVKGWNGLSQKVEFVRTEVPVPLEISAMVRCRDLVSGELILTAGRKDAVLLRERLLFFSGTTPWKKAECSAVIPVGSEYLTIQVRNHGYGMLYLDDLKIMQGPGKKP